MCGWDKPHGTIDSGLLVVLMPSKAFFECLDSSLSGQEINLQGSAQRIGRVEIVAEAVMLSGQIRPFGLDPEKGFEEPEVAPHSDRKLRQRRADLRQLGGRVA
ncbi:hypothetical protein OICFNHDK_4451 [Methylobacterium bullatum]|uniref:Uncharacterized protein n=1 Tax=Methylobacterium bullatum TaxID=570505 RepID=A0AAV4ZD83_9HYPH|nr:hypothetical protein [Methylobacterium bullatum]GJD41960.1 hypothetical protein OICFNHDK_4451 [Methylobacterium bullatum]